jgi:hypothetical protein
MLLKVATGDVSRSGAWTMARKSKDKGKPGTKPKKKK